MKLDKETVIKHQFWFLLGGYFLFWLVAVLWLWSTASGEIVKVKKAYEDNETALKSAQSNPINTATFLPPWEKEATIVNGHKIVIWNDAWDIQKDMYTWPKEWEQKDMANLQTPLSTDELRRYRDNLYPDEIEELRKNAPLWLNPVELAGGFDSIFQPKKDWKETPTREECRLSQEDFWVKRELLLVVWKAMADQAIMFGPLDIDEKKEPKPKGVEARYRYRNQNWEITLHIRKNDKGQLVIGGDSTIKNVNPTRRSQPLTSAKGEGIRFNVAQVPVQTRFEVRGEPVGPEETRPFSEQDGVHEDYEPLDGIVWERSAERPISISQGFDQTNSPIRCINALAVAKQDCRTFTWPLQANQALTQLDPIPEDESKKTETTGVGGPGGAGGAGGDMSMMQRQMEMMKQMKSGGGMGGGNAAEAAVVNPTPNNAIERNRYLQPASQDKTANPPSRHLPLALQLIVEQEHMQDVLVTFANSRLRFQITQVEFHRAKDWLPQSESDKKGGTELSGMGRNFMGPMPGMYGGGGGMQQKMQQQMQMQRQMQQQMGGGGDMQQKMQQQMQMQRQMQQRMGGGAGMLNPMMGAPPMMMPSRGRDGKGGMGPSAALPAGMRGGLMQPGGGSGDTKTAAANRPDDNLVEVTVYGIATLYRRPDAPAVATTTGQPAPLGQPSSDPPPPPAGAATTPSQPPAPPAGQPADKADKTTPPPPPSDKR